MSVFSDNTKPLVVVTTVTQWDEPPRIRHQVTRQLTRFYNVLYVQLFRERKQKKINNSLIIVGVGRYFRGLQRLFYLLPMLERFYKSRMAHRIQKQFISLNYKKVKLVNFQFDFPEVLRIPGIQGSLFILNDDFINRDPSLAKSKRDHLLQRQKEVIRNSDTVLAVSNPLVSSVRELGYPATLFLPGVELPEGGFPSPPPESFKGMRPIKVCFMGYINSRLDIDWLATLAKQQDVQVDLIGPIERDAAELLKQAERINILPPVEGIELFSKLASYHSFMIPYKTDNDAIKAITASNKFFQYLATGRPVVISDMPHFIETPDRFVYRASSAAEFVEKIYQTTREDTKDLHQARMAFAKENSWDYRGDFLYACLEKLS